MRPGAAPFPPPPFSGFGWGGAVVRRHVDPGRVLLHPNTPPHVTYPLTAPGITCRSRHRQATRRRLAGSLAPLSLEREWLFGVLPPSVTANVLGRLDATSRKALRVTCRRTRLCVSSFTQRLILDGRGLRRFTVAPLSLHFPYCREIHLAGPGSVAAPPAGKQLNGGNGSASDFGGSSSRGGGGGTYGGSTGVSTLYSSGGAGAGAGTGERVVEPWQRTGPAQLLALMEGGALASLPSLRLLDLSRCVLLTSGTSGGGPLTRPRRCSCGGAVIPRIADDVHVPRIGAYHRTCMAFATLRSA